MTESRSTREQPKSRDRDEIARVPNQDHVISQLMGMVAALWASRKRNKAFMLFLALVAVVGTTAYAQIRLNAWNRPFYNALSDKNVSEFLTQLGVFAELGSVLLVLNVAQTWLNQKSKSSCAKAWSKTSRGNGLLRCEPFAFRTPERSAKTPISESMRTPDT